jgi:multidrug efflux pump subunit AcrA (membrane-fusion protein)
VDEADRGRLQPQGGAMIRVDAVPDRELMGTIDEISAVAKPDFTTWPPVRNFDITIALSDTDARLRSGMSASARLELDRIPNTIVVPAAAIFQRGNTTIAYVVVNDSVESRTVTVLRRSREQVAITSGLRDGERVSLKEPDEESGGK